MEHFVRMLAAPLRTDTTRQALRVEREALKKRKGH